MGQTSVYIDGQAKVWHAWNVYVFFFLRCVCSTHIWRLNDVDGATDQSSVFNTSTVCNYLITVVWAPVRCTHTGRSISTFSFCCCVTLASAVKQNGVDTLILSDLKKKPQLKTNCIAEAISGGYRGSTPNPNRFITNIFLCWVFKYTFNLKAVLYTSAALCRIEWCVVQYMSSTQTVRTPSRKMLRDRNICFILFAWNKYFFCFKQNCRKKDFDYLESIGSHSYFYCLKCHKLWVMIFPFFLLHFIELVESKSFGSY